ncbi:MAG: hypothetical protein CMO33_03385 [Verrucomicrobia bacterium]|nr:hypothetical protein [Verrucomicrobiota bacterium]
MKRTPYSNPKRSLTTAVILHVVFLLTAGFLAIPEKKEDPEHLFELVLPPATLPSPEPEPAPPPPEPISEPEPPAPEPEPTPPPPPEPVAPEPPPPPKPTPKPKPVPRKVEPKPKPTPPPVKRVTPKPPPVKKVLSPPKPIQRPLPKPTPLNPSPRVNALPTTPVSQTRPRGPIISNPPPITQAAKDNYLGQFYAQLQRYWNQPPDGFQSNKSVTIRFTVSSGGILQTYSLSPKSGDAQLDGSILQALASLRSRGVRVPPPGGRGGTFQITVTPE